MFVDFLHPLSLSLFSELCCSEFRSSGWSNPASMSCEGYEGRNPSVCPCQHSLWQYHMTCGRWQGWPLAFRVTADDSHFTVQFLRYVFIIFWGERLDKSLNLYIFTMYNISNKLTPWISCLKRNVGNSGSRSFFLSHCLIYNVRCDSHVKIKEIQGMLTI